MFEYSKFQILKHSKCSNIQTFNFSISNQSDSLTPLQPLQALRHDPQLHLVVPPVLDQHERQLTERRTALLQAHAVLANVPRPRVDLGGVVHLQHLGQRADLLVRVVDDAHPRRGGRGAVEVAAAVVRLLPQVVRVGRVVGVGVDVHAAHEGRGAAAARGRRSGLRVEEELQLTGDGGVEGVVDQVQQSQQRRGEVAFPGPPDADAVHSRGFHGGREGHRVGGIAGREDVVVVAVLESVCRRCRRRWRGRGRKRCRGRGGHGRGIRIRTGHRAAAVVVALI